MSLFDVIKYPISEPPTEAELRVLPANLYTKWCMDTRWQWVALPTPSRIADFYFNKPAHYRHDVSLLRKMIKEYDDI